ncbi:MAG TPA: biopolymer transporter ExbD [Chitinophagaceae bacterium]|nr:biopolymer transporter ExbD [Chitinophagaceae bacterium]
MLVNETQTRHPLRRGVKRPAKHALKTDMTPMVDLGFLLISFFVFTAELSKPTVTNLNMPKEGIPSKLGKSQALTVLPGNENRIYYYEGEWEKSKPMVTNYSFSQGLGQVIRDKQNELDLLEKNAEGRSGLMLLIKPGPGASYRNVIDVLDETFINAVKKYVIVKPDREELAYINRQ